MVTIGITGTIGAGKGTVVEHLKVKGFRHYSVRQFLLDEISRRNIEPTRDNMRLVADDFRKISTGYIIEQFLARQKQEQGDVVIESIRALGEIDVLTAHAQHFFLLAVDADPKIRYERILLRNSSTDNISFEKFQEDELIEMKNDKPWQMNLAACIAKAEVIVSNNGTVEELYQKIDEILATLGHKNP